MNNCASCASVPRYGYFKTDFLVDTFRPLLDVSERGYDKIDKTR